MVIRKANSSDAKDIAPLFLLAMGDIVFKFIENYSATEALKFMTDLVATPQNQYSYDCCWVLEDDQKIIGATNVYDGAKLAELRQVVAEYIMVNYGHNFNPEVETEAGEYYIDCVGVRPEYQGQGIGSRIFNFLIDYYVNQQNKVLGLLVDDENPKAESLYLRLGFETVGEKQLVGKKLKHMQIR